MNIFQFLRYSLTAFLLFTTANSFADQEKALINSDYVRVREKPGKDATPAGFLYKNMVVEVSAKSQEMEKLGNDSYYWYEIKNTELHGWVLGKFLTTSASNWNVDTYDAPGDTQWLTNRFGDSTWYGNQKMNMRSFSMDDYRNLMRAAENGSSQAWSALRVTILAHLNEEPNDANYAYLKMRLHSEKYLLKILSHSYAYDDPDFFSVVPHTPRLLAEALKSSGVLLDTMTDADWNDKEVVLLSLNYDCSQNKIPSKLALNSDIKTALARCKSAR